MSVIGAGMWYFHAHPLRTQSPPEPVQSGGGEIVIAKAPDGTLTGRWQSPSPASYASPQR